MGQWSYLYARKEWRIARASYLRANPLCVMCKSVGKVRAASVVDHIEPHKGDMRLFWDLKNNAQALCKWHHDSTKHHHESSSTGCDEQGIPLHPTNNQLRAMWKR